MFGHNLTLVRSTELWKIIQILMKFVFNLFTSRNHLLFTVGLSLSISAVQQHKWTFKPPLDLCRRNPYINNYCDLTKKIKCSACLVRKQIKVNAMIF